MKKRPESVTAVIITDEPTAGSRPSLIIVIGIVSRVRDDFHVAMWRVTPGALKVVSDPTYGPDRSI
jgi:hypothetical protein